uniref:Uncharacterized protein n=1 Tax=Anopheles culicifacies TaxID=139723 RepID=A0A182MHI2_9DIPT
MATQRNVLLWKMMIMLSALVALLIAESSTASPLAGPSSSSTRLRRVHKSTHSEVVSSEQSPTQEVAKTRPQKTFDSQLGMGRTFSSRKTTVTTAKTISSSTLQQRVDQAVQKVRARSKEIKMEQEQKRVDRKLRRDQKKQEREQIVPAASINPHNLKMPDCPTGKVYNGRRCVTMGKLPKH